MNTGVIVLAHRRAPETEPVAEWYAERLRERGRKNVKVAYHDGSPGVEEVLREIRVPGVNNTMVVLPLLISEGDLSTWVLPKGIGMPDNSCSYTYITGTHIAIRFSTTFGRSDALSEALMERLSEVDAERTDGILLLYRGSRFKTVKETFLKHAGYLSEHGYPLIECNSLRYSDVPVSESLESLKERGAGRIVVLPMFLYDGKSVRETIPKEIEKSSNGIPVICTRHLGCDERLLDDLDRKIPEDW